MQNVERREPDASLFQIPPDYTITESVMPENRPLLPQLIPAPAVQKPQ